jgi:hypothetical protein
MALPDGTPGSKELHGPGKASGSRVSERTVSDIVPGIVPGVVPGCGVSSMHTAVMRARGEGCVCEDIKCIWFKDQQVIF